MKRLVIFAGVAVAALSFALSAASAAESTPASPPPSPVAQRGIPAEGQAALRPLIGKWRVRKTSSFPGVAKDGCVASTDLNATREWVGGGRFVREVVQGSMGGKPYWRMGLLGYSNMDKRFEWVTVDELNANMMIYLGKPGEGAGLPIDVTGTFTDQGLLGEDLVGKPIGQRTTIMFDGDNRTISRLYVTPPGVQERLADEMVFEKIGKRPAANSDANQIQRRK